MASFFEKLKKGMGIDPHAYNTDEGARISEEKTEEEKLEKKLKKEEELPAAEAKPAPQKKKARKLKIETKLVEVEPEVEKQERLEGKGEEKKTESKKEKWFEQKGQLAVDVYQTENEIVIQSTIAGVKPEDLDISIEADAVLIKGSREQPPETGERNYFYQECYWGLFSRQIILPEETDPNQTTAEMKEGILTIRIPKIEREKKRKITVKG